MAPSQDLTMMLNQLDCPAFIAENGVIVQLNENATKYMLASGQSVLDIIQTGLEEYRDFSGNGCLYLTLSLFGKNHGCTVTALENGHLFLLNNALQSSELQALSLAAAQLTNPVSEISLILDRIQNIDSDEKAKISKNLYRLQRIIGNMSDAITLTNATPSFQLCELCSILEETLDKAKMLLSESHIQLQYSLPNTAVYAPANEKLLARAIYNLISNSAKFSEAGSTIQITGKQAQNKFYIIVTDNGSGMNHSQLGNVFHRYTRQPGLEDHRFGLGVGLRLVHSVAALHGGTVLLEQNSPTGTKITITLSTNHDNSSNLRSPVLIPDIYGGQDPALIELSDVLPYKLYKEE